MPATSATQLLVNNHLLHHLHVARGMRIHRPTDHRHCSDGLPHQRVARIALRWHHFGDFH
jgi:hypothetical protein